MLKNNNTYNPDEELKDLAPILFSIKKENPFKVPDGYFESISSKIASRISEPQDVKINKGLKQMISRTRFVVSLAAASVLIFLSIFLLKNRNISDADLFSGITLEQILEEEPAIIESLDEYFLLEILVAISDEDAGDIFESDLFYDSILTDDGIIDFLSDDEIDTDIIYN